MGRSWNNVRSCRRISAALATKGIHLDPMDETFQDGQRRLTYDEVLELLPGATNDEIASWKKTISEPETKKRWSIPPSFIDATMASDHSSAACSCQIPADCVASMLQGLLFLDCEDDLQRVV